MTSNPPSTKSPHSAVREYRVAGGRLYSVGQSLVLGLLTALVILLPIAQLVRGADVQWPVLVGLLPIGYMWFMFLRPVRSILLHPSGEVLFKLGIGSKRTSASAIQRIRPMFGLSSSDFIVEFRGGSVLLFRDPTLVAVFSSDLLQVNPDVVIKGVAKPPGSAVPPAA